jgi:hypothetical protein
MRMNELSGLLNESKNIISAESKFAQERYKYTYTWKITPQIKEQIYDTIFENQ